jgi:delta 1-pyrroline-5-carboxylate dehydrogenase
MRENQGVYIIWSADGGRAYVGESFDCDQRKEQHAVALSLGCRWELAAALGPGTTRGQRQGAEAEVANRLKANGIVVVSVITKEQALQSLVAARAARDAWWSSLSPEERARRGKELSDRMPRSDRSEAMRVMRRRPEVRENVARGVAESNRRRRGERRGGGR